MKLIPLIILLMLVSCNSAENCSKIASLPEEQKAKLKDVDCSATEDNNNQDSTTDDSDTENSDSGQDELPEESLPDLSDVPNEAFMFNANIDFNNFEVSDEQKVEKAVEIIKKVIQSSEFKDKVLNFSYKGNNSFYDTNLSNEAIYQKLLDGQEELRPELDHEMDLELELYYASTSTVGYTYQDGLRIWMNKKFFNQYTPSEVAGNLFHEWTHKLGFTHATKYSLSRDSSVPYALGYLIEELGQQYE